MIENINDLLEINSDEQGKDKISYDNLAIVIIKIFAWMNLIGGPIGAFLIFKYFGYKKIEIGYSVDEVIDPFGISIAIISFLQGIFGWALLIVIASIAKNLISIKKPLL